MDLDTYNKGVAFGDGVELDPKANSDHTAIQIVLNDSVIGSINISNKAYHHHFNKGPFEKTHMNTQSEWLDEKAKFQQRQLIDDLVKGVPDVQIVVEGYYQFLTELSLGPSQMVSVLDRADHGLEHSTKNITALLVNTDKYQIEQSGIYQTKYIEDPDISRKLVVPWVHLIRQTDSVKKSLFVLGVHVPGCDSQFPKQGLVRLNDFMETISGSYDADIVTMGDFNTIPNNIRKIMTNFSVLTPEYPTHINPNLDIVSYDNIVYKLSDGKISQTPIGDMHEDTQALVKSLVENRNEKMSRQ